jgi:hypothetical protein
MYGLREDTDLSFLVGREVLGVQARENNLHLKFDSSVEINIESKAVMRRSSEERIQWTHGCSDLDQEFRGPVGSKLQFFRGDPSGTLEIDFSNGSMLTLFEDSREYKSYTISGLGVTVVV